ncbi:hypothetical protein [Streptomyces sp. NRRL B-24572]|uniref:hypothetical protein n=1 Tax=Streptomyces sp. NRRL B-24572 TaxID=1962156 RepID=UPI000A3CA9EB|nr:hypothetical protein [Streptomyces sp. NRRL B-24572]
MSLLDAAHYSPDDMLMHPRHIAMQSALAHLIEQVRAIDSAAAGYEFQQELLDRILEVDRDRYEFKKAAERIKKGKSPHPGAPEPQSGRDLSDEGTWRFEHAVCERLGRQLRSVGDALAWRAFGFHRPFVLALSRNDSPGPMHGKSGLAAERDRAERAFKDDGHFALLHDVTNCLRIGDITIWDETNPPLTEEIKTNPNAKRSTQLRRVNQARAAILDGGPLPGPDTAQRLHDLDLPLRTHLDMLRSAAQQAAADGVHATVIPGARALAVVDQQACSRHGLSSDQFNDRFQTVFGAALASAGIASRREVHNWHATTLDSTARDPLRVPWANYPLDPALCARIIGDYVIFTVETSGPLLTRLLRAAGLDAHWIRPPGPRAPQPGEVFMEIHHQDQLQVRLLRGGMTMTPGWTLQMAPSELDRYLLELLQPGTWIAGIRHLLAERKVGRPWPHFQDEHEVWV